MAISPGRLRHRAGQSLSVDRLPRPPHYHVPLFSSSFCSSYPPDYRSGHYTPDSPGIVAAFQPRDRHATRCFPFSGIQFVNFHFRQVSGRQFSGLALIIRWLQLPARITFSNRRERRSGRHSGRAHFAGRHRQLRAHRRARFRAGRQAPPDRAFSTIPGSATEIFTATHRPVPFRVSTIQSLPLRSSGACHHYYRAVGSVHRLPAPATLLSPGPGVLRAGRESLPAINGSTDIIADRFSLSGAVSGWAGRYRAFRAIAGFRGGIDFW